MEAEYIARQAQERMGYKPYHSDLHQYRHLKYSRNSLQGENAYGFSYESEVDHVAAMAKKYMGYVPFKADMSHFKHLKYTGFRRSHSQHQ